MSETTPDRIAHGRAMLNTIERHCDMWEATLDYDMHPQYYLAIKTLRAMYAEAEEDYRNGLITEPDPRILPSGRRMGWFEFQLNRWGWIESLE